MTSRAQDRMLKSGHTVNRIVFAGSSSIRPPDAAVAPAASTSTKRQAERAIATVAEVLGRDPKTKDFRPKTKD